jgi:hypothetical protein
MLRTFRLDIVDAHVLVCDPSLGVATEIDVLAQGPHGLVVVENKTTLQTRAEHERTYKKPDRVCPLLLRGFLSLWNSEYNHHQLQLAYMLIMLKNTYNIDAGGVVLVATCDGLCHYPMNPAILALARTVVNAQVHFFPVVSSKDPLLNLRFRGYLPKLSPCCLDGTVLKRALAKFKATEVEQNVEIGKVAFYERPDLVVPVMANIRLMTPTGPVLLLVRALTCPAKLLSVPVSTIKLPSGHQHSRLNLVFLELAILVRAFSGPALAAVVFLPEEDGGKAVVRNLPKTFAKSIGC